LIGQYNYIHGRHSDVGSKGFCKRFLERFIRQPGMCKEDRLVAAVYNHLAKDKMIADSPTSGEVVTVRFWLNPNDRQASWNCQTESYRSGYFQPGLPVLNSATDFTPLIPVFITFPSSSARISLTLNRYCRRPQQRAARPVSPKQKRL
jgi:hypothetical protein